MAIFDSIADTNLFLIIDIRLQSVVLNFHPISLVFFPLILIDLSKFWISYYVTAATAVVAPINVVVVVVVIALFFLPIYFSAKEPACCVCFYT